MIGREVVTFRIAVVGAGVMGRNHARVLRELPGVEFAGIVDADPAAAKVVADLHRVPQLKLDDALKDPGIDALVISTPTFTHRDIATKALKAGKHVLVEKPLALDAKEAEDMVRAAQKAGRTLAVGHIERHNPAVKYAHDALRRGEFGQLITLTARRVSNFPGRIRDVGVILDLGVHDIDVVRYLVGSDPVSVAADAGTFTPGLGVEDHAAILLTFPGGVTGVVEVNWLTPMKVRRLSLTASEQYVEVDYMAQALKLSKSKVSEASEANMFQLPLEMSERSITLRRQEPLKLELEDFVAAATTGRPPLVTGADGLAVLQIAQAAVEAARGRKTVKLSP